MNKKEQALHMYLNESCTQQHIATTLGISLRTLYNWIRQNSWDRLKQASLAAPVIIADNMCFQLLAMQQTIAEREAGQQFPTIQEAEITRKLVICIDKLKRYPSLTQSMQVLETFRQYVQQGSERDSWPIERWMGKFMSSKAKGGFRPNDIEYNAENLSPFGMPFEEDDIDDITTKTHTEPNTEDFPDQPEIATKMTLQEIENQLIECHHKPHRMSSDHAESRQQSEVKQQIAHPKKGLNFGRRNTGKNTRKPEPTIHNSSFNTNLSNVSQSPVEGRHLIDSVPDFSLEDMINKLTAENFKDEHVSPETVAAYRQSLMLVMEANMLDYEEGIPEISSKNTQYHINNQRITSTSDTPTSRQQSEVSAIPPPYQRRA